MDIPFNVPLFHGTVGMQRTTPLSHGTMGWDGQWDTHASVEGQVGIPWNVPLSHGTVGWDGQFTAFLDIYGKWNNQHISISRPCCVHKCKKVISYFMLTLEVIGSVRFFSRILSLYVITMQRIMEVLPQCSK